MSSDRAGTPAQPSDLVDVAHLVTAYYTGEPDPSDPAQRVAFGTSGHRGSSLDNAFNQTHILATTQAISQLTRVDRRLKALFWHLAERWGRVLPDGIAVPLPLSHQRLADLVGAHRPAVTSAMGELTRKGSISRREDRVWILHGSPPEALRHHRLAATMS